MCHSYIPSLDSLDKSQVMYRTDYGKTDGENHPFTCITIENKVSI